MQRLIVHAGFHKTGTTTVQKTLRKNRGALRPHLRTVLRPGMLALCEAARAYSVTRSEWDIALVKYEAAMLAESLSHEGTVLLSSEDLSGHMPGRRGLRQYDAAPRLMSAIDLAFREAQPDADISYAFVTRAPDPWLASCHVQHLRATRMVLTVRDYSRKFRKSADLEGMIDKISAAIPHAQVHRFALETCSGPLGPLAPLLDLAGVPDTVRGTLKTLPPANTAPPPAKVQRLLELNQSDLTDDALKDAKRALNKEPF